MAQNKEVKIIKILRKIPNIPKVLWAGKTTQGYCTVYEKCGASLGNLFEASGFQMPPTNIWALGIQVVKDLFIFS